MEKSKPENTEVAEVTEVRLADSWSNRNRSE